MIYEHRILYEILPFYRPAFPSLGTLRIPKKLHRIGFFGFQSHAKRIGMDRGFIPDFNRTYKRFSLGYGIYIYLYIYPIIKINPTKYTTICTYTFTNHKD